MLTRAELKSRAKACLRHYYWWAFLACLIAGLLGGGNDMGNFKFNASSSTKANSGAAGSYMGNTIPDAVNPRLLIGTLSIFLVVLLIICVVGFVWRTFVGSPIRVGCCRFFMESREKMESAGIGRLFHVFESGKYGNVVKTMFMRNLFIVLWTLLLVIPGIIKSYQYYLVPYIMQDDPRMNYRDALALSKDMMDGYKWNLFVLRLSFIGWEILGVLCCGIGMAFVIPYEEATFAEFYAERRNEKWTVVEEEPQDIMYT